MFRPAGIGSTSRSCRHLGELKIRELSTRAALLALDFQSA
jgi:hypothetical protein